MDCFWKGKFMIEMKSLGENLDEAMDQALNYYLQLKKDQEPRYILVCDFEHWYLRDKKENTDHFFILSELVQNIGLFGFMTNRHKLIRADPVNLHASEILGKIFDMLKASGYGTHHTEYFLTRLVFCLFADDTGIFGDHGKFQSYIKNSTHEDGSDLGRYLAYLFRVLNQDRDSRSQTMDSKTRSFPYINGALFERPIEFPDFNTKMRELLIQAGEYDWSKVSPAIFGNMFQTVMDQDARREMGAHYTSEENILKVIRPLFLDDLNEEYDEINKTMDGDLKKVKFIEFQNKLASLKFLDPACGSGNFLVIAYREIRRLEHRVIMKIYGYDGNRIDTDQLSKVDVDQFYGIELIEFSARIAETSLWMMDHIMNVELSKRYGYPFRRIPIKKKPNIVWRDALEVDWNEIIASEQCSYIFGNPPFSGSKMMTFEQREQIKRISNLGKSGGTLDFVTGWFIKASQYMNDKTLIGFVSTSSITQGEAVGQLWTLLYKNGLEIDFAYTSFKWESESKKAANVSVVIIGMSKRSRTQKTLFFGDSELEDKPKNISPYLFSIETKPIIVLESSKPLNGLNPIKVGSQLIDGGFFTFTTSEKDEFLVKEPESVRFFKPYINAKDFIDNKQRWILVLKDIHSKELGSLPEIKKCVESVRDFRSNSKRDVTKKLANTPTIFAHNVIPTKEFLIIPRVSSENRKYIPIGYVKPPAIPSDATMIMENATLELFGLITSKMHMVWLKIIGGKLESRLRYSGGLVYNTFPIPHNKLDILKVHAEKILNIREKDNSSLADLYHPTTMPPSLLKAHQKLDEQVEKLYRKKPFESDQQRINFLLEEYQKMIDNNQTKL